MVWFERVRVMGYCGYKCEQCPVFQATKKGDEGQLDTCQKEWAALLGRNLKGPLHCEGCYRMEGRRADPACPVSKCCQAKKHVTCAECTEYPCADLNARLITRQAVENRLGEPLAEERYRMYVAPYENKNRLDLLRKRYKPQ